MNRSTLTPFLFGIAAACILVSAEAAAEPKFEFGKAEEVKKVEWKASAQASLLLSRGNANSTTMAASATASRKAGNNKFSAEAGAAYAKSDILLAIDSNGVPGIGPGEIQTIEQTTTNMWNVKARYDRFFTANNSGYVTARATADEPAGNELLLAAQAGYSRQVVKTAMHELLGEVGYDFSSQNFVAPGDVVEIHSGRFFAGYTATLSKTTALTGSAELLTNINEEDTPTGQVDSFEDNRVLGKLAMTTQINQKISIRFAFTAKYDQAPAPRPAIGGAAFEPGYMPLADELDVLTEIGLIFNVL